MDIYNWWFLGGYKSILGRPNYDHQDLGRVSKAIETCARLLTQATGSRGQKVVAIGKHGYTWLHRQSSSYQVFLRRSVYSSLQRTLSRTTWWEFWETTGPKARLSCWPRTTMPPCTWVQASECLYVLLGLWSLKIPTNSFCSTAAAAKSVLGRPPAGSCSITCANMCPPMECELKRVFWPAICAP